MPEAIDLIKQRRSVRKFTSTPVEKAKLLLLLQAAMAAPTASNSKPWEFVVVTETAVLDKLRAAHPSKYNGTAAIIVCGNPSIGEKPSSSEANWMLDCSAATENLLIEAAALGLGAVWCGVWPGQGRIDGVAPAVGLPPNSHPLNLVWLGYPDEVKEARTQYDEKRVHWQRY
jgi:nitroreductase